MQVKGCACLGQHMVLQQDALHLLQTQVHGIAQLHDSGTAAWLRHSCTTEARPHGCPMPHAPCPMPTQSRVHPYRHHLETHRLKNCRLGTRKPTILSQIVLSHKPTILSQTVLSHKPAILPYTVLSHKPSILSHTVLSHNPSSSETPSSLTTPLSSHTPSSPTSPPSSHTPLLHTHKLWVCVLSCKPTILSHTTPTHAQAVGLRPLLQAHHPLTHHSYTRTSCGLASSPTSPPSSHTPLLHTHKLWVWLLEVHHPGQ